MIQIPTVLFDKLKHIAQEWDTILSMPGELLIYWICRSDNIIVHRFSMMGLASLALSRAKYALHGLGSVL